MKGFEVGVDMMWILIATLALILIMLGFYIFMRPGVQGGWMTSFVQTLKWLVMPP